VKRTHQSTSVSAVTTGFFIHDGNQIVLELEADGDVVHRLLWGPAVDQAIADENGSNDVYWYLTDHQGTVRDVAVYDAGTESTDVANHITYNSFGRRKNETSSGIDDFDLGYTGKWFDRDTDLQWNLNRWYDSATGRWLSEDPIGFAAGDANLSRYVGNGPTNYTDPRGLAGELTTREVLEKLKPFRGDPNKLPKNKRPKTAEDGSDAQNESSQESQKEPDADATESTEPKGGEGTPGKAPNGGPNPCIEDDKPTPEEDKPTPDEDKLTPEELAALVDKLINEFYEALDAAIEQMLNTAQTVAELYAAAGGTIFPVVDVLGALGNALANPTNPVNWAAVPIALLPGSFGPSTNLHRPYIRVGVWAEVEARAPRAADGRPIDPNNLQPIDGTPDLGHKTGREFWREKAQAEREGLTQPQFNDRMNNPDLYQLEDPASNRSHRHERPR
jgi:RHS repeat-associated protein